MSDQTPPSGIATDDLNPEIRPQDDLFRHVNGQWLERTEIPADKARYGSFLVLAEEAEKAVREIIEEAQTAAVGTEERAFGDLYASFMDEDRIEQLGAEPARAQLAIADAITSIPELLAAVGRLERAGLGGFYQLFVDNDPGNPDRYLVFVEQSGISLPDESYYREESFASVREAYLAHVQRMFELAGFPDGQHRAQNVFDLETAIASHHWDNVASRDSEKTYNLFEWRAAAADVGTKTGAEASVRRFQDVGGNDFDVWREALGAPAGSLDEVVLRQPEFTSGLASPLTVDRIEAWKDWLAWQIIHGLAPFLSAEFVEENFDFYGRTLTGTPQMRDRWKRGVSLVEGAMGEAVGRIYVDRHFPPAAKESMDVLVANLIEAYRQSIQKLEWMGEETRGRALDKLEKFTPKIGFPVKWRDYSKLPIEPTDLVANVRATSEFEFNRELGKIGKPLDRDEWFMTPQTI
ncbi:MAG: metallopeptidase, partial [Leifsonia sp.]|nr:metallopeptidase [Leifsonia sp.]